MTAIWYSLEDGISVIEHPTGLAALSQPRVFVRARPIPVRGPDAFPPRAVAFERMRDA